MNKTLDFAFELKSLSDAGKFEGYGSVFGVKDSYDEIVAPGAFADTLAEQKAKGRMPAEAWDQVAELLGCSTKTAEDLARRGELPGLKPGGAWVFPAGALAQRLDQLATEQAAARRVPATAPATTVPAAPRGKPRRALPVLVQLGPDTLGGR